MKNIFKSIIRIVGVLFIIGLLFVLSKPYVGTPEKIKILRDELVISHFNEIKKILNTENNYSFNNLSDFNKNYKKVINPPKGCYYLKSIYNDQGFLLVSKLESKKYIKKYNNDYLIYKSIADYIITDETMINIKKITSTICNN